VLQTIGRNFSLTDIMITQERLKDTSSILPLMIWVIYKTPMRRLIRTCHKTH